MLRSKLSLAKQAYLVSARQLASLIGTIIAMSIALGPDTRLMTRNLYAVLNDHVSWCQKLTLSKEVTDEIQFWLEELSHFNRQRIWPTPSAVRVVYSDASATGYRSYFVEHDIMGSGHLMKQHRALLGEL